jgi:hypothetical protein
MRVVPPSRLPSSVASDAFLRADDREALERDRAELYVAAAELDRGGLYGDQVLYWLRGPWGNEERVLALEATLVRRRQVGELQPRLRSGAVVGPVVVATRAPRSGHHPWARVDAAELRNAADSSGPTE